MVHFNGKLSEESISHFTGVSCRTNSPNLVFEASPVDDLRGFKIWYHASGFHFCLNRLGSRRLRPSGDVIAERVAAGKQATCCRAIRRLRKFSAGRNPMRVSRRSWICELLGQGKGKAAILAILDVEYPPSTYKTSNAKALSSVDWERGGTTRPIRQVSGPPRPPNQPPSFRILSSGCMCPGTVPR